DKGNFFHDKRTPVRRHCIQIRRLPLITRGHVFEGRAGSRKRRCPVRSPRGTMFSRFADKKIGATRAGRADCGGNHGLTGCSFLSHLCLSCGGSLLLGSSYGRGGFWSRRRRCLPRGTAGKNGASSISI